MPNLELPWEVGKSYRTKGGLKATITKVKPLPIPKEISQEDLERILSRPFFGIEGYVQVSGSTRKMRGSWTYEGHHTTGTHRTEENVGDLTTEVISDGISSNPRTGKNS